MKGGGNYHAPTQHPQDVKRFQMPRAGDRKKYYDLFVWDLQSLEASQGVAITVWARPLGCMSQLAVAELY